MKKKNQLIQKILREQIILNLIIQKMKILIKNINIMKNMMQKNKIMMIMMIMIDKWIMIQIKNR